MRRVISPPCPYRLPVMYSYALSSVASARAAMVRSVSSMAAVVLRAEADV